MAERESREVIIGEKTAKIKDWVHSRLKELESQNASLRAQNVKCNRQLELLTSAARRSSLLLTTSAHATLMSRSMVNTDSKRGSDDSGTTSDAPPDATSPHGAVEWPRVSEQCRVTTLSISTHSTLRAVPLSKTAFPVAAMPRTHSLPRDSLHEANCSPRRRGKPVPKPRKKDSLVPAPASPDSDNGTCGPLQTAFMERDSLDLALLGSDEELEEALSLSLHEDYVNLAQLQDQGFHHNPLPSPPEAPLPPAHRPQPNWEKQLQELAEQCMVTPSPTSKTRLSMFSVSEGSTGPKRSSASGGSGVVPSPKDASPGGGLCLPLYTTRTSSRGSRGAIPRNSTESSGGPADTASSSGGPRSSAASSEPRRRQAESSEEDDYALPPEEEEELSPVEITRDSDAFPDAAVQEEKAGYLNVAAAPDARLKTWKRRWFAIRDMHIHIFKSKHEDPKTPLASIFLWEASVTPLNLDSAKHGGRGFELRWPSGRHLLTADTGAATDDWLRVVTAGITSASEHHLRSRLSDETAWLASGWVSRVRGAHSRRLHARLIGTTLVFTKSPTATTMVSRVDLRGATAAEVARSSDDSGSDEAPYARKSRPADFSLSVSRAGEEPTYLVLASADEKESWLYHLRLGSRDGVLEGTPFEVLVQRLMAVGGNPDSELWADPLLNKAPPALDAPLTSLPADKTKEALEMYKSCLLFSQVPMQGSALQYHIDLAQGVLAKAVSHPMLQDEVMCQLLKLSGARVGGCQSWQLLALATSLFAPPHYTTLWLLRKHLERWAISTGSAAGRLAFYCQSALARTARQGGRKEGPSRVEALSLFSKDPSEHARPHSLPVSLPDDSYHIVAFDGSSLVQELVEELCGALGLRHPLYSGFALAADHPLQPDLPMPLNPKHKICDVLTRWEREMREGKSGRVPTGKLVRLSLRARFHWPHLLSGETDKERLLRCWATATELHADRLPASPELAEHLAALLAQLQLGPISNQSMTDQQFSHIMERIYPMRLATVACRNTLRCKLASLWSALGSRGSNEIASAVLSAVRHWPVAGGALWPATLRWRGEEPAWVAVSSAGLHLLVRDGAMEELGRYPFSSLLQFGGCRGDLQVTVSRASVGGDGPGRERLVFAMAKADVLQATLLIADYIKVARLVCVPSAVSAKKRQELATTATVRRSPQKQQH